MTQMESVLIDCDPGVDDALALILALSAASMDVAGITTVDGNVGIEHTTRNTFTVLELCGQDVAVHRGAERPFRRAAMPWSKAHGADGLGEVGRVPAHVDTEAEDAKDFLIRVTAEAPGEHTLVALGPLTNIAHAIEADPDFPQRVKRLLIMGGAEFTGNVTPSAEFNFLHDPEAAQLVFTSGFDAIDMIGLDVTKKVFMSPGTRELIRQFRTPVSEFIHDVTQYYSDYYWQKYQEVGSELCDPLVVAQLLDEDLVTFTDARVEVETAGLCQGRSVVWRTERYRDVEPNCRVATDVDSRRFFEIFLKTIFPQFSKAIQRGLDVELR
jgi:purine nucleosidase